jgi:hypothetical protein
MLGSHVPLNVREVALTAWANAVTDTAELFLRAGYMPASGGVRSFLGSEQFARSGFASSGASKLFLLALQFLLVRLSEDEVVPIRAVPL